MLKEQFPWFFRIVMNLLNYYLQLNFQGSILHIKGYGKSLKEYTFEGNTLMVILTYLTDKF